MSGLFLLLFTSCHSTLSGGEESEAGVPVENDGGAGDDAGVLLGDGPIVYDGGVLVPSPDGGTRVCYIAKCQNHVYECGDCIDNDPKDGRIDSDDPDCLGPCDNSEDGLHPAISGGNNAPCKQDCYFDQDTGSGNDECYWDHRCDPHEVAPDFHPEGELCKYDPGTRLIGEQRTCKAAYEKQSTQCLSFCGPLTPNGCDCFGCCVLGTNARNGNGVWLGSLDRNGRPSCTLKDVNDPAKCRPCQIVMGCFKPCGECQLCIGKNTLPAKCFGGGGDGGMSGGDGGPIVPDQCSTGIACGLPGQPPCPAGWYCVTGCCVPPIR